MTLRIERMTLRLPHGLAHRAPSIAREVSQLLAGYRATESISLASLRIGPVQVSRDASDRDIAGAAAKSILRRLRSGGQG